MYNKYADRYKNLRISFANGLRQDFSIEIKHNPYVISEWIAMDGARARRVAASLVNSVLRCSWYLVTRCLSEIRAARTRGGEQQPRDSDAVTRLWEARRASRRPASPPLALRLLLASPRLASRLRRHIMPACSSLPPCGWCERPRLDSTRLDSIQLDSTQPDLSRTSEKRSTARHRR